jgi:predicted nucleotidyltransferase
LETLRRAAPDLEHEYGITRLALFGSFARGEATEASDVDVLVDVHPSIGLRFVDLAERIEALLAMPTDVVFAARDDASVVDGKPLLLT